MHVPGQVEAVCAKSISVFQEIWGKVVLMGSPLGGCSGAVWVWSVLRCAGRTSGSAAVQVSSWRGSGTSTVHAAASCTHVTAHLGVQSLCSAEIQIVRVPRGVSRFIFPLLSWGNICSLLISSFQGKLKDIQQGPLSNLLSCYYLKWRLKIKTKTDINFRWGVIGSEDINELKL